MVPGLKGVRALTAAAVARISALIVTVFLVGCNAPHSQEAGKAERAPDPPVRTVELTASHDAVKLEGVATILNMDALLQLDGDIRSAKVAADFSSGQLARFRLSTMLSRQTLDNAERQAGIDASQLKLLETRTQADVGRRSSVLKNRRAPEPNRRDQRRGASHRPLRFSRPRQRTAAQRSGHSASRRFRNARRDVVAGPIGKLGDARRLVFRAHSRRSWIEAWRQGAPYRGQPG